MGNSMARIRLAAVIAALVLTFAGAGLAEGPRLTTASTTRGPSNGSLRRMIGERFVVGFSGTVAPAPLVASVHAGDIGGVIIYSRNIASRSRLRALVARLQAARPRGDPPLLISIDQEGGLVKRLDGAPTLSEAEIGRRASTSLARDQGRATAQNLRSVGVNVDLAPVLDVARPDTIMAQTDRSYGSRPALVSRMGLAFVDGLARGHVAATAKHFPGLGDATSSGDDHLNPIELSRSTLRKVDETPFRAAAHAGFPLVMVSAGVYPALDDRPALFVPAIAREELRNVVGFKGVSISNDLDGPAIQGTGAPGQRALRAAEAGEDLLLFGQSPAAAASGERRLIEAARTGEVSIAALRTTAARIEALRRNFG